MTMTTDRLKALRAALPMSNRDADIAALSAGYFEPVIIVNRNTWQVLTDHTRRAALATNKDEHPIIIVDVPADEEIAAAVAYSGGINGNLTGAPDTKADAAELARAALHYGDSAYTAPLLLAMGAAPDYWSEFIHHMTGAEETPPFIEDDTQPLPQIDTLNDYDIPALDMTMQATLEDLQGTEFTAWGSRTRAEQSGGVLFYVSDSRFTRLDRYDLPEQGVTVAIEPNYSTSQLQPRAIWLYDVWRKRTIASEWQRGGTKTIVDVFVARDAAQDNMLGVPIGWKAYANRYSAADPEHLMEMYLICQQHAQSEDILYIVYGTAGAQALCEANGWHFIDSEIASGWKRTG